VNYTFSKALGIRNDYRTGYPSDPTNLANNYGVVAFDRTHILNFVYSYQEGNKFHGNRILQGALNGWEISGITGWQSGQDLSVLASQTGANYGLSGAVGWTSGTQQFNAPITNVTILGTPDISLQPLLTCNPTSGLHSISQGGQTSQQFVNGNCFALPQPGQNGAFNLPYVHGPAYFNTDLSVFKNFGLGEKRNLQFRLSGFNFLNHPIDTFYAGNGTGLALTYSDPSGRVFNNEQQAIAGAVPSSTFGYTPYRTGRRLVEVAVKYDF